MALDRACTAHGQNPRIALTWEPQGKRSRGRHGGELWRQKDRRWVLPPGRKLSLPPETE